MMATGCATQGKPEQGRGKHMGACLFGAQRGRGPVVGDHSSKVTFPKHCIFSVILGAASLTVSVKYKTLFLILV